ncbi:MAG TPA: LysM domain-containing protein [Actinomycetota bacterium]|nr:LysM domain-containing protein [Actinomycetota bacterium]
MHARRTDHSDVALFPRGPGRKEADQQRERAEAMRRHPAGKALNRYVVREGDTLWSIAQRELQTEDIRSIARFWPKIHRANRDSIPDPSLIMPGQVLVIPDAKEG